MSSIAFRRDLPLVFVIWKHFAKVFPFGGFDFEFFLRNKWRALIILRMRGTARNLMSMRWRSFGRVLVMHMKCLIECLAWLLMIQWVICVLQSNFSWYWINFGYSFDGYFGFKAFRKDSRAQLTRKELFKNTLRKATYAWKRILELKLSGRAAWFELFLWIVLCSLCSLTCIYLVLLFLGRGGSW